MMIHMPSAAQEILEKLNRHGFEAYIVGGCVRDSLLGKEPEDWDITTSARPEEVKSLFGRTIDTGILHGTVTIMKGKKGYEVTTYRIDGKYEDGRHPKEVAFTSSLEEDLKRRDFTINAMAYSHKDGLIDLFGGVKDMEDGRIRCVGTATDRFGEDALRMLRALRFSAQLGFEIEENTWNAIKAIGPNLANVSKERIQTELTKLLLSDHPNQIRHIFTCNLEPYISPAFSRIAPESLWVSPGLPALKYLRWASCLMGQTPKEAAQVLRELKMDNDTICKVTSLVQMYPVPIGVSLAEIRKAMSQMPEELFDSLLLLKRSIVGTDGHPKDSQICQLDQIQRLSREIRLRGDCIHLKMLAVTGSDLIAWGMKPGKQIGQALHMLLEHVLEHPEDNQKEILMQYLDQYAQEILS